MEHPKIKHQVSKGEKQIRAPITNWDNETHLLCFLRSVHILLLCEYEVISSLQSYIKF